MMKQWLRDTAERVLATYLEVWLGLVIASKLDVLDVTSLKAFTIAAIPSALVVLKAAVATKYGDGDSAAMLPASDG